MELRYVPTVCPFCGTGCSFNLVVKDGRVAGVAPFQRSPVCDGKTCQKGHYAYELVNSEARITTPLIKKGDELVEASWDDALAVVADGLKGVSGGDVAVFASANATNEDIYSLKKLASDVFKTENFTSCAATGVDASAGSIRDIAKADCIVAVGNIFESHPLIARRIANAKDNGAKIITVDSINSSMAKLADEFVKAAPGGEIEAVKEAAAFVEGSSIVVLYSIGVTYYEAAVAAAAKALADEKGATFCALPSQSNARGALDIGVAPAGEIFGKEYKAYYVMGEDLGPIEGGFVVVQDSFLSGTAKSADVVLPAAVYAEVDGTVTNAERRIQLVRKAQEPAEGVKANWQIVSEVAEKLGGSIAYESAEAIFNEMYGDLSYDALQKDGFVKEAKAAVIAECAEPAAVSAGGEYPFALVTGPTVWHGYGASGTLSENCHSLVKEIPAIFVKVNPADAKELDVKSGQMVSVSSEKGSISAMVKVSKDVDQGIIFVPTMSLGGECICKITGGDKAIAAKIEKEA
ncbi:MAG: molybdopterin-dependent oxidoreductase [Methanomicrobiaceae archaeon]|nr:molybdopterin-dependent oxidoreductase [Methanomicrobiaceae archaeon]